MKAAATSPSAPMLFWPPAPSADPEGMALEIAERLVDGVVVDTAHDGRDGRIREPEEQGDRLGSRQGEVEAGHPLGLVHPAGGEDLAIGRDAGEDPAEVIRRHGTLEPEAPGTLPQPETGRLPRSRVVLLDARWRRWRCSTHPSAPPSCRWRARELSRGQGRTTLQARIWPTRAKRPALGTTRRRPEPDHGELATGDQFVGEGPGDPEHLARLGHGVDEALFGCLEYAVSGCHGRHCRLWTSTAMTTKVSTPANF